MNDPTAPAYARSKNRARSTSRRGGEAPILAVVGDRNLVFSEANQAIYELGDLAAYIWRSLDAGLSADQIIGELFEAGVDPAEAKFAVPLAIAELQTLHFAAPGRRRSLLPASPERLTRLTVLIADVAVQLNLAKSLVADVEAVFGPLITDSPDSDLQWCAIAARNSVRVLSPDQPSWSCERAQFIPLLKAELIDSVLRRASYEVALHAAALARDQGAVLLLGAPGAGKTTLGIALAKAGLAVLADDVVLLKRHGLVSGLALPFTAKASSWPLLSRHWPGITDHPHHCRPDGQTLCYIPLDPVGDSSPRRISVVVVLDRQVEARTRVEELDPAAALAALVAEGATRDERLTASGFTALIEGLRGARCCRLTYSDLEEAAGAVCGFPS